MCIARAEKRRLNRWMDDLMAQYQRYKWTDHEGKTQIVDLQLGVREVKILEFCYPKEEHEAVMRFLQPGTFNPKMNKFIAVLRKMIGFKKYEPKKDEEGKKVDWPQHNKFLYGNVEVTPIGLKDDIVDSFGTERI